MGKHHHPDHEEETANPDGVLAELIEDMEEHPHRAAEVLRETVEP